MRCEMPDSRWSTPVCTRPPDMIAVAAVQEDVDAVGLSIMSGAHNTLFPAVMDALTARGADDIVVFGGGIVPEDDLRSLLERGCGRHLHAWRPTRRDRQLDPRTRYAQVARDLNGAPLTEAAGRAPGRRASSCTPRNRTDRCAPRCDRPRTSTLGS